MFEEIFFLKKTSLWSVKLLLSVGYEQNRCVCNQSNCMAESLSILKIFTVYGD